ncbi:MAG TPA: hypothetical protein VF174_00795 [Micromonosporaceae bacterium]
MAVAVRGATREILVVLVLAAAGLLLAGFAAFGAWHDRPAQSTRVVVVKLPPEHGDAAAAR